jgi:hypothetical protein
MPDPAGFRLHVKAVDAYAGRSDKPPPLSITSRANLNFLNYLGSSPRPEHFADTLHRRRVIRTTGDVKDLNRH